MWCDPDVKFMWCDPISKYWPWAKKMNEEVTKIMLPALSVMHAKAHGPSCQVSLCTRCDLKDIDAI